MPTRCFMAVVDTGKSLHFFRFKSNHRINTSQNTRDCLMRYRELGLTDALRIVRIWLEKEDE